MIDPIATETWKRCDKCGLKTNSARGKCECGGVLVVDPSANPSNQELVAKFDKLANLTRAIGEDTGTLDRMPPYAELNEKERKVKSWLVDRISKLKSNHATILADIRADAERKRK
jgi:hypothetical protein